MALGDVYTTGDPDLSYVDTEMYDTPEYGAVYVLDADRPAIVDSGMGTNYEVVLDAMDAAGIAPEELAVVALTHVHLDHAGGAGYLCEACPNAEVYVHGIGAPHIVSPERLWEGTKQAVGDQIRYYVEPRPVPAERITELEDGDEIDLGDRVLGVHHAPGHAPHQVVFRDRSTDGLFVADAAGICTPATGGPVPTTPPPNFDLETSLATLEKLGHLEPSALYYPHFGDFEPGDRLASYERTLVEWVEAIAGAREELGEDDAVVERFREQAEIVEAWGEEKSLAEVRMNVSGVLDYLDRRGA